MKDQVSKILRDLRAKHNKTNKQVADALDIKTGRYQHYEAGRVLPPLELLIKLANMYGLTLDQLVKGEYCMPEVPRGIILTQEQVDEILAAKKHLDRVAVL